MTTSATNTKPAARKAAPKSNVVQLDAAVAKVGRKRAAKRPHILADNDATPLPADETPVVETKPARKRAAKAPVTGESVVETHPLVGASITIEQVDQLATAHELATAATEAFELLVCELLAAGASPSHVGKAVGLGNSSIRRIGWRHGIGTPPPAKS